MKATLYSKNPDKSIISDIDEVKSDGSSGLQYVFQAIDAFNAQEYASAIEYCDAFFKVTKNQKETDPDDLLSLQRLEPQEQISLNYYMQLVYADSHFRYAKIQLPKRFKGLERAYRNSRDRMQ